MSSAWPGLVGSSPLTRGGPESLSSVVRSIRLIPAYAGRTVGCYAHSVRNWAHPRLRGADTAFQPSPATTQGSSPLTRGGPPVGVWRLWPTRLIPAYAGRTANRRAVCQSDGAHPRLRGADEQGVRAPRRGEGSSPLTRGGLGTSIVLVIVVRLIPAYAGRTVGCYAHGVRNWAHPRLRGADNFPSVLVRFLCGSSPLTRGGLF